MKLFIKYKRDYFEYWDDVKYIRVIGERLMYGAHDGSKYGADLIHIDHIKLDGEQIWTNTELTDCEEDGSCIPRYVQEGCGD